MKNENILVHKCVGIGNGVLMDWYIGKFKNFVIKVSEEIVYIQTIWAEKLFEH